MYVTNHPDIVTHAGYCYRNYHTIVNNIPKETKTYQNTPDNYAAIDNKLAASQNDIGISSNLAQIAMSYSFNYQEQKYDDYVCILSVLAQAAIDSSKRRYLVDVSAEILRIKKDMDIKQNGYPRFWRYIHPEYQGYINNNLKCPMNEVVQFRAQKPHHNPHPIPNQDFFIKYELNESRRKCKRVENLIQKYSFELLDYNKSDDKEYENYLLLRSDFEQLIQDIRNTYISNNYLGLMSWLIDRSLRVTDKIMAASGQIKTTIDKNRSLLLKVLYTVSPSQFLQCFTKKCTAEVS